ncbi:hypothetical protein M885DRAFT_613343 [Pelagophyceae sp. CCMP2097]|nr:hypothetical protein M885DRAFT_613343 [Pelagophyceae sp. CCMP2097]
MVFIDRDGHVLHEPHGGLLRLAAPTDALQRRTRSGVRRVPAPQRKQDDGSRQPKAPIPEFDATERRARAAAVVSLNRTNDQQRRRDRALRRRVEAACDGARAARTAAAGQRILDALEVDLWANGAAPDEALRRQVADFRAHLGRKDYDVATWRESAWRNAGADDPLFGAEAARSNVALDKRDSEAKQSRAETERTARRASANTLLGSSGAFCDVQAQAEVVAAKARAVSVASTNFDEAKQRGAFAPPSPRSAPAPLLPASTAANAQTFDCFKDSGGGGGVVVVGRGTRKMLVGMGAGRRRGEAPRARPPFSTEPDDGGRFTTTQADASRYTTRPVLGPGRCQTAPALNHGRRSQSWFYDSQPLSPDELARAESTDDPVDVLANVRQRKIAPLKRP